MLFTAIAVTGHREPGFHVFCSLRFLVFTALLAAAETQAAVPPHAPLREFAFFTVDSIFVGGGSGIHGFVYLAMMMTGASV